jgi:hypothetical protein
MEFSPDALASRLKAEGEAVQAFFGALAPEDWQRPVYTNEGLWQARDLLAHFVAAEQGFQQLLQDVAAGGPGVPPGFDIDAYNRQSVNALHEQDSTVLLGQFAMVRERTVALVAALYPEMLAQRGGHPFLGVVRVDEMIRAIYHHNSLHLRDLRRALRQPDSSQVDPAGAPG